MSIPASNKISFKSTAMMCKDITLPIQVFANYLGLISTSTRTYSGRICLQFQHLNIYDPPPRSIRRWTTWWVQWQLKYMRPCACVLGNKIKTSLLFFLIFEALCDYLYLCLRHTCLYLNIFIFCDCYFSLCEPLWALLSWICCLCSPGVLDHSGSDNSSP